jgi:hypothetical protein
MSGCFDVGAAIDMPKISHLVPATGAAKQNKHTVRPMSFAQHATTMFFPHFVGDTCTVAVNPVT